jgi:WD40 repeat protein
LELGKQIRLNWQIKKQKKIMIGGLGTLVLADYVVVDEIIFAGFRNGEFVRVLTDWEHQRPTDIRTYSMGLSPVTSVSECVSGDNLLLFVSLLGYGEESGHVDLYRGSRSDVNQFGKRKQIEPALSRTPIMCSTPSLDSQYLLIGSDRDCFMYSLETFAYTSRKIPGSCILTQKWVTNEVFLSGNRDGNASIMDIRYPNAPAMKFSTGSPVSSMQIDTYRLITCSINGSIILWDVRNPLKFIEKKRVMNDSQAVTSAQVTNQLVVGTDDGMLYFFDSNTLKMTSNSTWSHEKYAGCVLKERDDTSVHLGHGICLERWST